MRQRLQALRFVAGILLAFGLFFCLNLPLMEGRAEASFTTKDALTTVGVTAGIGTVIGLSTISFYDSPGSHLDNALMGAGAGLILGLGIATYMMVTEPPSDEISPEELLFQDKKGKDFKKKPGEVKPGGTLDESEKKEKGAQFLFDRPDFLLALAPLAISQTLLNTGRTSVMGIGLVRKSWVASLPVLELRF